MTRSPRRSRGWTRAQRGVPADIVEKCFLGLHRCDELPLELWIGMITDAYNLATAIAAAPSYDAVRGQVQAERRT